MSKYHQVIEGDWTPIPKRGHMNQCCDCCLTHVFDYREKDGVLEMRVRVNHRATAAAWRAFKFTPERD